MTLRSLPTLACSCAEYKRCPGCPQTHRVRLPIFAQGCFTEGWRHAGGRVGLFGLRGEALCYEALLASVFLCRLTSDMLALLLEERCRRGIRL